MKYAHINEINVPAFLITSICKFAMEKGIDAKSLLLKSGIESSILDGDSHSVISVEQYDHLIESLSRVTGPSFSVEYSEYVTTIDLSFLCGLLEASETIGSAIIKMKKYGHYLHPLIDFDIINEGDKYVGLRYKREAESVIANKPIYTEFFVLTLMRFLPLLARHGNYIALSGSRDCYSQDFLNSLDMKVFFGASSVTISFESVVLDQSLVSANPFLNSVIEKQIHSVYVHAPNENSIEKRIYNLMSRSIGTEIISLQWVSEKMGISTRSLQRTLKLEGVHFKQVFDQVRFEKAQEMLCETNVDVQDIAAALCYSEPTSFYRAFKKWSGDTPKRYRMLHANVVARVSGRDNLSPVTAIA